jgi:hypothetical protein
VAKDEIMQEDRRDLLLPEAVIAPIEDQDLIVLPDSNEPAKREIQEKVN